jgi:hypothetical protein
MRAIDESVLTGVLAVSAGRSNLAGHEGHEARQLQACRRGANRDDRATTTNNLPATAKADNDDDEDHDDRLR